MWEDQGLNQVMNKRKCDVDTLHLFPLKTLCDFHMPAEIRKEVGTGWKLLFDCRQ